jgi:aryl-alcohol dehydrogenase-like predicted oxidoreductase
MRRALELSLKRLQTDYIDLYWVHLFDGMTPVEETMRSLDDAVRSGKVLHVGVSDFPAWKVSQANTLAELRGWSPFTALQIEYSLAERTVERDLIPMAMDFGMGVTPWSPLGQGVLTGKYSGSKSKEPKRFDTITPVAAKYLTKQRIAIGDEVVKVAKELGRSPAQVALAWLMNKPGVTSIILGARKPEHLTDNLGALSLDLPPDAMKRLDAISAVDAGFYNDFVNNPGVRERLNGGTTVVRQA